MPLQPSAKPINLDCFQTSREKYEAILSKHRQLHISANAFKNRLYFRDRFFRATSFGSSSVLPMYLIDDWASEPSCCSSGFRFYLSEETPSPRGQYMRPSRSNTSTVLSPRVLFLSHKNSARKHPNDISHCCEYPRAEPSNHPKQIRDRNFPRKSCDYRYRQKDYGNRYHFGFYHTPVGFVSKPSDFVFEKPEHFYIPLFTHFALFFTGVLKRAQ